jgi:Family of unknown function (DUF5995)
MASATLPVMTFVRPLRTVEITAEAATSIDGVLERMYAIDDVLSRHDGVAHFNRLYLRVTERVLDAVRSHRFLDRTFLDRLDVDFANLYFAAFDADQRGHAVVSAWAPLFAGRARTQTFPIQFALTGMNAHINHDLPIALVTTCALQALDLDEGGPAHRDYTTVNAILSEVEHEIKAWFTEGFIGPVERALGKLDDALALWSICAAREVAWENGQILWSLKQHPKLERLYTRTLARSVSMAGRAMLV